MVERAQPRGGDDEHRRGELRGDVRERAAVVVETDEQAARALDEHEVVVRGQLQRGRDGLRSGGPAAAPTGRAAVAGASGSG